MDCAWYRASRSCGMRSLRLGPSLRSLEELPPTSTWKEQPCPPTKIPRIVPHFTLFGWGKEFSHPLLVCGPPSLSLSQNLPLSKMTAKKQTLPSEKACPTLFSPLSPDMTRPSGFSWTPTTANCPTEMPCQSLVHSVWRGCLQSDAGPVQCLSTISRRGQ